MYGLNTIQNCLLSYVVSYNIRTIFYELKLFYIGTLLCLKYISLLKQIFLKSIHFICNTK